MTLSAPRPRVSDDATANAQAITAALAMQHTSLLPFTLDDCFTLRVLSEALELASHLTRAERIRRLYSRLAAAVLDARAGNDPEEPHGLSICDAADVYWSRSCRGLASDERERAHLLAFRIMRAVDWTRPRAARFALTAAGRTELLGDDARPYSVEQADLRDALRSMPPGSTLADMEG